MVFAEMRKYCLKLNKSVWKEIKWEANDVNKKKEDRRMA